MISYEKIIQTNYKPDHFIIENPTLKIFLNIGQDLNN